MIDVKQYIESGILELYVFGTLPEQERIEVSHIVASHPELLKEVERIENAMQDIARAAAPGSPVSFNSIESKLEGASDGVIPLSRKRTSPNSYLGWAAAVLMAAGLGYMYNQNNQLEERITDIQQEQILQEGKTQLAEDDLAKTKRLLNAIRSKNVIQVPLGGQDIAPDAYASVYWDKKTQKSYIDVSGLPAPPEGKVYQVWSLTLNPLTPTSMGILDAYNDEEIKIFELDNPNESQAFGITLEPAGGSESPTLEQLYTLGTVS